MEFLCNMLWPKHYFVEIYAAHPKNRSFSNDLYETTESQNQKSQGSERSSNSNNLPFAYAANIQALPTTSTLKQPMPFTSLHASNSKPPGFEYVLVQVMKIIKKEVSELLKCKDVLGDPQDKREKVLRMIKKSQYQDIIIKHYNDQTKWKDKSFQLPNTSIHNAEPKHIQWKTLQSALKYIKIAPWDFIGNSISPKDIAQGSVGDCYFLGAVAALSRRPERILRLFPPSIANKNGIYMSRMMFKGIYQEIIVDDLFPVLKNQPKLLGCHPAQPNFYAYAMILEKCWAKLWGSYQKIDGGRPHQALHALTGAVTKNYVLKNETQTNDKNTAFFRQVLQFCRKGYVMCAGTNQNTQIQYQISQTISDTIFINENHIYSIEEFDQINKTVRLYNPWGYNNAMNPEKPIQGEFTLSWDQFITSFHYLTVCKVHDNAHYLYTDLETCKKDHFTFVELNIHDAKTGYFAITVSETDKKENESKNNPYLTVTYVVMKYIENLGPSGEHYELMTVRTESKFSDHYLELHGMTAGRYMIAIYFSEVEVNEHLTFGVNSEDTFTFSEIQMKDNFTNEFMHLALQNYDRKRGEESLRTYPIMGNSNVWFSFTPIVFDSVVGYIKLHVGKSEQQRTYKMVIDNTKDDSKHYLSVWGFKPDPQIVLTASTGEESIIVIYNINRDKKIGLELHKPHQSNAKQDNQFYLHFVK